MTDSMSAYNLTQSDLVVLPKTNSIDPESGESRPTVAYENALAQCAFPIDGIASFCRLVDELGVPFKPRTPERPWALSAGRGGTGKVECHRYVPGHHFNNFNNLKAGPDAPQLYANSLDPTRSGQYYAVKRLDYFSSSKINPMAASYDQIATELRVLSHSALRSHDNIIRLLGLAHYLAEPCLVLEVSDCGNLEEFFQLTMRLLQRRQDVKINLCKDVARGLEVLHRHGVVHSDIKCQNILVTRRNTSVPISGGQGVSLIKPGDIFVAKICDFGYSIILTDINRDATILKGKSWKWAPPEALSGTPIEVGLLPQVDIFSAGLVFCSILLEGMHILDVEERISGRVLESDKLKEVRQNEGAMITYAQETIARFPMIIDLPQCKVNIGQMYCECECNIFNEIFEVTLSKDPRKRLSSGGELLDFLQEIWESNHRRHELHMDHCSGALALYEERDTYWSILSSETGSEPSHNRECFCDKNRMECSPVPSLFQKETDFANGVFDVRTSFRAFRATMTEDLSKAIVLDLIRKIRFALGAFPNTHRIHLETAAIAALNSAGAVEFATNFWETKLNSNNFTEYVTGPQPDALTFLANQNLLTSLGRKGADCAYQLAMAFLKGFGVGQNNDAAIAILYLSWRMGCPRAYSDFTTVSSALYKYIVPPTVFPSPLLRTSFRLLAVTQLARRVVFDIDFSAARAVGRLKDDFHAWVISESRNEIIERKMSVWTLCAGRHWKGIFCASSSGGWMGFHKGDRQEGLLPYKDNSMTILHWAASSGRLHAVKELIVDHHQDVSRLDDSGWTAFDHACFSASPTVADYLLDRHGQMVPPFPADSCPLQNLVLLPKSCILDFGARILRMCGRSVVNARNKHGMTPLLWAMHDIVPLLPGSQETAIDFLLEHGASPLLTVPPPKRISSLSIAASELRTENVRSMLHAIRGSDLAQLREAEYDSRPQPAHGIGRSLARLIQIQKTDLILAGGESYEKEFYQILDMLVADETIEEFPHCQDSGYDLLGWACYYSNSLAVKWMIFKYPNLEARFPHTFKREIGALLGLNLDCGHVEMVKTMLSFSLHRPLINSSQILHSVMHHQPSLLEPLFEALKAAGKSEGVLSEAGFEGATVFDVALQYGNKEIAQYLLNEGATYDGFRLDPDFRIDQTRCSPLSRVLGNKLQVDFLWNLDPKPSLIVTESGMNVFHTLAAKENVIEHVSSMGDFKTQLETFYEADPSLVDRPGGNNKYTPFHIVALHYASTVGEFLRSRGADINARDKQGRTPLDLLLTHGSPSQSFNFVGAEDQQDRFVCDYALSGPVFWELEGRLYREMVTRFQAWGAKTKEELEEMAAVPVLDLPQQLAEVGLLEQMKNLMKGFRHRRARG